MRPSRKKGLTVALVMAAMVEMSTVPVSAVARSQTGTPAPTPKLDATDTAAVAEFMKRVNEYIAVHTAAEKGIPVLAKDSTPRQIDARERSLATKIQAARPNAQRGEIFTPAMAAFAKRIMIRVFSGKDGAQLRASIQDENVKYLPIKINQRYPDDYPLTTMPPDVLKALPQLPEEMEYRFVGSQLILLDTHAHIIPDFVPDALPPVK